ncbi:MAG TPA: shikimate dehydrogenase [Longimicrobium sp.]|nr:shikimate dehydrogenase [Longimicrobium sp.]
MTPLPTASTRLLALLGDPVSHSLSPVFQNAALRVLGLDGVYVALRCASADLPGLLVALARAGGGGNVTVPHKAAAARAVELRTEAVDATGACNCFWLEDGRVHGDNTDVHGLSAAVRALLGRPPAGARVLVVGAGGAARAAVYALAQGGAERIVVVNRTADRARELAERFGGAGTRIEAAESAAPLASETFDLALNATSLGLRAGDPLPLSVDGGPGIAAALDLVYARGGETPWVRAMREAGIPSSDGTEVLLHQGAEAFRRWWKLDPPIGVMREALTSGA